MVYTNMPTFKVEHLALPYLIIFAQSLALLNHGLGHRLVIPEYKRKHDVTQGAG